MIYLDGTYMCTKKEAHEYLQEQLHLPEYYGKNLDALHDCLTEMQEGIVCFRNIKEESYAKKVWKVFRQAEKENPCIQVILEDRGET